VECVPYGGNADAVLARARNSKIHRLVADQMAEGVMAIQHDRTAAVGHDRP
jgi:hypothetical protein